MSVLYLLSGSNLGNREQNLENALLQIHDSIGKVVDKSSIYETEPWGISKQPMFLNQAIKALTRSGPVEVLQKIKIIERAIGRKEYVKWSARIIDIDILYYDKLVIKSEGLNIPHSEIINRKFVLAPLVEIAPDFIHPGVNVTNRILYEKCEDTLRVCVYL